MNHVAIDLASRQSQICVRAEDSTILQEGKWDTRELQHFFESLPSSRVILESCTEAEKVAVWAQQFGHSVRVVPSLLSRQLGVGQHGVKTDQRDARNLSLASCRLDLPSIHQKSSTSRDRWNQLVARQSLVTARTQLINTVRGYLRAQLVRIARHPETFPRNVRHNLLETVEGLPTFVEQLLAAIEELNRQITMADEAISRIAKSDSVCQRFMEIPGIGPMTSLAFVCVVDDPHRFSNAQSLQSYLGLTPGERSSGKSVRRVGITKAGPPLLRQYLTQASLTHRRCRPLDPLTRWAKGVEQRRGKQVATIATARKLGGILWAMWRDQTSYSPIRSAQRVG